MAVGALKTIETNPAAGLRAIELAVTSRCNFRCSYCGAFDLTEREVLSAEQCIEIIDGLPDLQRVKLSGGEVLIRYDDCLKIVAHCHARGLMTQINTNGTLLNPTKVTELNDAGLDVMHFSLDFTDAEKHSAFYGVRPAFFERIINAIDATVQAPHTAAVAETILFDATRHELRRIHEFVADHGIRQHEIQMEVPSVHEGYSFTLGPAEIAEALVELIRGRRDGCTLYFSCLSAYFGSSSPEWAVLRPHLSEDVVVASCIEGKSQLHVHSTGDVMICELGCPEIIGNVFETPLREIFANPPERLRAFIAAKHDEGSFVCLRNQRVGGEPAAQALGGRLIKNLLKPTRPQGH